MNNGKATGKHLLFRKTGKLFDNAGENCLKMGKLRDNAGENCLKMRKLRDNAGVPPSYRASLSESA